MFPPCPSHWHCRKHTRGRGAHAPSPAPHSLTSRVAMRNYCGCGHDRSRSRSRALAAPYYGVVVDRSDDDDDAVGAVGAGAARARALRDCVAQHTRRAVESEGSHLCVRVRACVPDVYSLMKLPMSKSETHAPRSALSFQDRHQRPRLRASLGYYRSSFAVTC